MGVGPAPSTWQREDPEISRGAQTRRQVCGVSEQHEHNALSQPAVIGEEDPRDTTPPE